MTWLYGGTLAWGKANQFLEGLQVEPTLNWYQHQPGTSTWFVLVDRGYQLLYRIVELFTLLWRVRISFRTPVHYSFHHSP